MFLKGGVLLQVQNNHLTPTLHTKELDRRVNMETSDFQQRLEDVIHSTNRGEIGYAYVDKYGFSHVVKDYGTAVEYAQEGTDIYTYHGKYAGGYALNLDNQRMAVPLPKTIPYGNETRENGHETPVMEEKKFMGLYPGYLGLPVNQLRGIQEVTWFNDNGEKDNRYLRGQLREVYIYI